MRSTDYYVLLRWCLRGDELRNCLSSVVWVVLSFFMFLFIIVLFIIVYTNKVGSA